MSKKNLFLVLLIIGTGFWGVSYSVTKWAVGQASSSTFLFHRYIGATIVLSLVFKRSLRATNKHTILAGMGLALPLVISTVLLTLGIKYTSASQASFLTGICVILVPLLKLLIYRTTMPLKTWLAGLIAFLGLFTICMKGGFSASTGDLYTITGAVGFSLYLIRVERQSDMGNVLLTIVPMFATCALLTGGLAVFDPQADWLPVSSGYWAAVAYCALFSTAYMYTVSNLSQKYIPAEKVAVIYLFEPVFGALCAFFMLGEDLSWRLLVGGSLIFLATVISALNIKVPFMSSSSK